MIFVAALGVVGWFGAGVSASALMARRGYDQVAWLVIGVLLGPIAAAWAAAELAWMIPRSPEVVDCAKPREAGQDGALVVLAGRAPMDVTDALRSIDASRLVLAQVLPFDGAKLIERTAADELRSVRQAIGRPDAGLVLLFGVPDDAVARYAREHSLSVVVAAGEHVERSSPLAA